MSEEFTHVGTVRRRPRSHERTQRETDRNGRERANGTAAKERPGEEAHTEFERETWYDRAPGAESASEPRRRTRSRPEERPRKALPYYGRELDQEPPLFRFPFDPWRLYGAARRGLPWILAGGLLAAVVGFFLGAILVDYKISLPLIRKTANAVHQENAIPDQFAPREYSDGTLYAFMKSGEVLRSVAAKAAKDPLLASLHVTPERLAKAVSVNPPPNPDWVILSIKNLGNLRAMPELINLYANEVVEFTRDMQKRESQVINEWLRKQIDETEKKIADLKFEMRKFSETGFMGFDRENDEDIRQLITAREKLESAKSNYELLGMRIASLAQSVPNTRLEQARQELQTMLLTRTEAHPDVVRKKEEIRALEQQQQSSAPAASEAAVTPASLRGAELKADRDAAAKQIAELEKSIREIEQRLSSRGNKDVSYDIKLAERKSLEKARDILAEKERQSRLYVDNALGYFGVQEPATMANVNYKGRWMRVGLLACAAGFLGLLVTLGIVLLTEALDTTLRTAEDITRVTHLPVLASLGDLRKMSAAAQVNWAFRTLTALKGRLTRNPDQSLVCGIISANHGEGRTTWVNLLVSAASQRGLRVLTVDTRPTASAPPTANRNETGAAPKKTESSEAEEAPKAPKEAESKPAPNGEVIHLPDQPVTTLETNVLSAPGKVAEQLEAPNAQPVVHIPLPGWVWNLERRKQWQKALESWRDIDNLVIFVELPPASDPESVLLAEHLPQVLWLVGSGMADAAETKAHLEVLRNARCNIVGAVLNQAPPPFLNARIARWFQRMTAALVVGLGLGVAQIQGAEEARRELQVALAQQSDSTSQPLAFSGTSLHKRAKWQERLTLGPGDVVDIHFFSNTVFTALSRTNVFIGPDGRINYLYANGIPASGLTVEELRDKIADALYPKYYKQRPTIVVVPVSFNSKKYYMLGKVNLKGAFTLDRPLTLIEAVAKAKGLETGLYQRTTVEMADLGHSFLVRNGEKLPINFEKLFLDGDLSQNVLIEPNDYVYFASAGANDIYVLGEVMNPGPLGFVSSATLLTAITDRGGFTDKAYKRRVLVVRGSLNEPETFVVDSGGMLDARFRDFKLQPRDIVYVARRPWLKAEDLLDEAAGAFIEGAMTTWAGANVGPIITRRLLPAVRIR